MEEWIRPYKSKFLGMPGIASTIIGWGGKVISPEIRYGKHYKETYNLLKLSEDWNVDEVIEYQSKQLKSILFHSIKNVSFYKNWVIQNGINIEKDEIFKLITKFPFISREIIRARKKEFVSDLHSPANLLPVTTGGSTGTPMEFFHQKGFTNPMERAFQWRQRNWCGFNYRDPVVIVRGRGLGGNKIWKKEPIDNALIISSYHLTDSFLPEISEKIIKHMPVAIQAYPSNAMILAKFFEENYGRKSIPSLKVVLCGSENLYDFQRNYLSDVFGCRIFSWYGQTEYVVLAGGCEYSDNYHVFPEYGYTELIRPDGSVITKPGEVGEIVGTSFLNFAMPFIRYRTGDYAEYGENTCQCGRPYQVFKTIYGREQNFVILSDGRAVSLTGLIFGQHFKAFKNIEKFQLVQKIPGVVTLRLVKNQAFCESDIFEIEDEIRNCIGSSLLVEFEFVGEIQPTKAGKHLFLLQELDVKKFISKNQESGTL